MTTPYTLKKLTEVEDSAAKFGMGEIQEARFCGDDLAAEDTGFSLHTVKSGQRQPFGHKHEHAEEIYVVIAGSGRVKLDDEIVSIDKLDAIRVAPGVMRAFEADDAGLQMLAFGTHHEGDGEIVQGWWSD
jgi:mannose-6-phosphate isomerase-like protein (cupin superfamily)